MKGAMVTMRSLRHGGGVTLLLLLTSLVAPSGSARAENWPCWRGPRGDGTSHEKSIPVRWDGRRGENIVWKVAVPGKGHASPIVWNDRVFVVSCLEDTQERVLLCLDTVDGTTVWKRTVLKAGLEDKHRLNSFASSTPATDGKIVVVAFFETDGGTTPARNSSSTRPITTGSMVVVAWDFDGNEKWRSVPGPFMSMHGFCTCPVLFEDLVIVNGDHDGDAYLAALDRRDGKVRWKTPRENKTRSYVTPIIRELGGRTQMLLSGSLSVTSYDPRTGKRYWIIDGPTEQFVASLVDDGERIFLTGGFPERHILAIRPDGHGNVTDTHILWRTKRGAGYVPSPIVDGKYFLIVSDNGIGSCFDTASGERFWIERLGPHFSASLVSADGLVHFLSDEGITTVVRPGKKLDIVVQNKLGERCFASPAISSGRIYLRAEKRLYCIGETGDAKTSAATR